MKVSAFPHTWKADYSFSCSSYLLFIPFWYYPRGAEGISQPALEPCGTPVGSPNSWDGSRQLIMILNYIYSNLDSFFLVSWFALELGMGIRNLALKNCNFFDFSFNILEASEETCSILRFLVGEARGGFQLFLREGIE